VEEIQILRPPHRGYLR